MIQNQLRRLKNSRWKTAALFCLALALLIAFGVQGFEHGRVNNFRDQSIQLPIIYSYENPDLFGGGDILLDARDSYVTLFYPAMGMAARYLDLPLLFFGLYILTLFVTVSAVYTLGETMFPGKNIGMFATVFWMAYYPNLGGDYIHSPFVTHSTMAIAIGLWAIVLILHRQFLIAAVLLGLAANINAMTVFFITFMWAFALGTEILQDWRKFKWRYLLIPVIMAVCAAPILIWRMSLPLAESSLEQFVDIMRIRLWYAVFPFSVNTVLWVGFFAVLGLYLYSWRFGKALQHDFVLRMQAGIALLVTIGLVFSEIIPLEFVIELQLIRSSWLINLFVGIYLAHMARQLLFDKTQTAVFIALAMVGALAAPRAFMTAFPYQHPAPFTLYNDLTNPFVRGLSPFLEIGVVVLVLVLLVVAVAKVRRVLSAEQFRFMRRTAVFFGFAAVAFTAPMFVETNVPASQFEVEEDWEDTLNWVNDNTDPKALFFTPPTLDGFRVGAQRSHLGNWKDGTVGIFNNNWAIEWYNIMLDFGFNAADFKFEAMTQDDMCLVLHKYEPDYLVVWDKWEIRGDAVYANATFRVIAANDLDCPTPDSIDLPHRP